MCIYDCKLEFYLYNCKIFELKVNVKVKFFEMLYF